MPYQRYAAALIVCSVLGFAGCTQERVLAPSPIIVPDAVALRVGEVQVFTVQNAAVTGFTVWSEGGDWRPFVRADTLGLNRIALTVLQGGARGHVFVTADIGSGRTPLVAMVSIQSN